MTSSSDGFYSGIHSSYTSWRRGDERIYAQVIRLSYCDEVNCVSGRVLTFDKIANTQLLRQDSFTIGHGQ